MLNKRLKILHLITGLERGGAELLLLNTVKNLDKNIFDIKVGYLKGDGSLNNDFKSIGIEVFHFEGRFVAKLFEIIKFLNNNNIDILHLHLIHSIFLGRISGWICKVPFILTTEHNLADFINSKIVVQSIYKATKKLNHKTIAISKAVKQSLIDCKFEDESKIEVLYNSIAVEDFNSDYDNTFLKKELGIINNYPIIGCISRLAEGKGHKYLIQAVSQLVKKYSDIKLILVGDGSYRTNIEEEVKKYNLQNYVVLTGNQTDVEKYLSPIDIFALTAHKEGFGIVLIEAMSMKKPIVASNDGGIPEIIDNEVNGLLVPVGDVEAIAGALEKLIDNRNYAINLAEEGYKKALSTFNIKNYSKRLSTIYLEHFSNADR